MNKKSLALVLDCGSELFLDRSKFSFPNNGYEKTK